MSVVLISDPSHSCEEQVIEALGKKYGIKTIESGCGMLPGASLHWFQLEAGFIELLRKGDNVVCWIELLHQFGPDALVSLARLIEDQTNQPLIALSDCDLGLPARPKHMRRQDGGWRHHNFIPITLIRIAPEMSESAIARAFDRATWNTSSLSGVMLRRELPDPDLREVVWCHRGGDLYHLNSNCSEGGRMEMYPIYVDEAVAIGRVVCGCCSSHGIHPADIEREERKWQEEQAQARDTIASRKAVSKVCPVRPAPGFRQPKNSQRRLSVRQ